MRWTGAVCEDEAELLGRQLDNQKDERSASKKYLGKAAADVTEVGMQQTTRQTNAKQAPSYKGFWDLNIL
ncbi:MAG: hypothetical protein FRX49_05693 [Trebouxia sp. A1-2]|nr:MAG: hypothetical protein FRX49_05693 [Trebouxia sp. A1-2]